MIDLKIINNNIHFKRKWPLITTLNGILRHKSTQKIKLNTYNAYLSIGTMKFSKK